MKVLQLQWKRKTGWSSISQNVLIDNADLVLCFGGREVMEEIDQFKNFKKDYPNAQIVYSSTAGEIFDIDVLDDSISAIIIQFENTTIKAINKNLNDFECSGGVSSALIEELNAPDLKYVFVLSDGQLVNGSELVAGMKAVKNKETLISGGLAGDGYNFKRTLVGLNEKPKEGEVVAIGFFGDNLNIGFGSKGGWDVMTKERTITKSDKNVLYELDGKSALMVYKEYLGESAAELPGAALYYPLSIRHDESNDKSVIRTILSINEEEESMTFAGNMPEGYTAQLMKRNPDRLIHGAGEAADIALNNLGSDNPDLAIIVSCVGRKIVLGQNIDEEVEEVKNKMDPKTVITGFYSYGEIGPKNNKYDCGLHNQTIAITTFKEN